VKDRLKILIVRALKLNPFIGVLWVLAGALVIGGFAASSTLLRLFKDRQRHDDLPPVYICPKSVSIGTSTFMGFDCLACLAVAAPTELRRADGLIAG
jgi:hypothetical protein